jgi:methionyl-tRNA formyltransferase
MIRPDENWMDLHFRLARIACDAIDAALKTLEQHSPYAGVEQDESQATWAPELKESDAYLRFDEPAEVIALRCRAMCPDLVPLNMGELALDDIRPEAGSVQNRARHRPETMHGGALVVAKAVKGVKRGIF